MDTPNPYLNYTLAGEPVALFGMFLITTVLMAYVTLSGPSKSEESEETDETQKESESTVVPGVGMMPTVVDTEEAQPEEPEAEVESEEEPEAESEEEPEEKPTEKPASTEPEEKPAAETVTEPKGGKGWFASVFKSKKDGKKRKSTKHLRKKHNAKTKRRTKGIRTPKSKR